MELTLYPATLIKRYKRFLADISLSDNTETTIHCANTGAMTGCAEPGSAIWFSKSDNLKRKYPFSWELSSTKSGDLICINTIRANQLAAEAVRNQQLEDFSEYILTRTEVPFGKENSRVDLLLTDKNNVQCYVEVKSVTLLTEGQGYFPDAKTTRGQKHLRELIELAENGEQACLLFAVLHTGIHSVKAASHIDPEYARLLKQAKQAGVLIVAYKAQISEQQMMLNTKIPVII